MRLTAEQLTGLGEDSGLIEAVDGAFAPELPNSLGVAVSGGGDSMALLSLAIQCTRISDMTVRAVTLNHGLRAEAADEAAGVARFCADHGIGHDTLYWDGARAQGNIAAAGRDARYELIGDWARDHGIGHVMLGHTADDIAETFLMRLARKSGVDGLSMMEPRFVRNGIQWARPLWRATRGQLREYLRRHKMAWVEDPTNENQIYDRPRARQVLSALGPLGISAETVKETARALSSARDALKHYTRQEASQRARMEGGDVLLNLARGASLPSEIRRRLLTMALHYVGQSTYPPRAEAVADLQARLERQGKHTLAGCLVTLAGDNVRIAREPKAVEGHAVPVAEIWDGRWAISGPIEPGQEIRCLGDGLTTCPDWRETGLARTSLLVSPAVWQGEELIAAPLAGLNPDWTARIVTDFTSFLLSH